VDVDDDVELLRIVGRTLELEGYGVSTASDGKSAVALFPECQPDLVILDIMMPGMDGLPACRQIREFPSAPIIMVIARSGDAEKVRGLRRGIYRRNTHPSNEYRPSQTKTGRRYQGPAVYYHEARCKLYDNQERIEEAISTLFFSFIANQK
jgi:CheY-like chemotaxis protein